MMMMVLLMFLLCVCVCVCVCVVAVVAFVCVYFVCLCMCVFVCVERVGGVNARVRVRCAHARMCVRMLAVDALMLRAVPLVAPQLSRLYDNVLTLRLRMPIADDLCARNFITKIVRYEKVRCGGARARVLARAARSPAHAGAVVREGRRRHHQQVVNIPNSMTVLHEMIPVAMKLAERRISVRWHAFVRDCPLLFGDAAIALDFAFITQRGWFVGFLLEIRMASCLLGMRGYSFMQHALHSFTHLT
jgi:hypothetical protein